MKTLCCVNSSCLRWSCSCFHSLFGLNLHHYIKLSNFFLLLLYITVSLIVLAALKDPSEYLIMKTDCKGVSQVAQCVSGQIIQRILFSAAIVFFAMIFLSNIRSEKAKIINEGLWFVKIIWVGCLIWIFILLGPSFFKIVKLICIIAWIIFSTIQSLAIIDLSYNISNRIKDRIQLQLGKGMKILNYLLILGTYAVAIIINYYSYGNWGMNKNITIVNSVFIGLFFLLAFFGGNKFNTVLNSGVVLVYLQALTYLASRITKTPDSSYHPSGWIFFDWFILLLLTFIGMLSKGSGRIKAGSNSINQKLDLITRQTDEQNIGYLNSNKWPIFYILMFIFSMSLPVMINQWYKNNESSPYQSLVIWQGILSLIIGYVIYIWSILSIKCYPDRDLSQLQSYFKQFQLS